MHACAYGVFSSVCVCALVYGVYVLCFYVCWRGASGAGGAGAQGCVTVKCMAEPCPKIPPLVTSRCGLSCRAGTRAGRSIDTFLLSILSGKKG